MERDKVKFAWIFDILLFSIIFLRCVDRYPIRHAAVSFIPNPLLLFGSVLVLFFQQASLDMSIISRRQSNDIKAVKPLNTQICLSY